MPTPAIAIAGIAVVVLTATTGDVMTASSMRQLGDLDILKAERGLPRTILAVMTNVHFIIGVLSMTLSFFSLLFTLSHADVSLVAPATGSLTFVSNAAAAKLFLKERVDKRRWIAAILVCSGVVLLKH
jgi:drug/metabolite transporter (DMT)-like permease